MPVLDTTTQSIKHSVTKNRNCVKNKSIFEQQLETELLVYPEWEVGHKNALQLPVLKCLATTVGYDTILTAII